MAPPACGARSLGILPSGNNLRLGRAREFYWDKYSDNYHVYTYIYAYLYDEHKLKPQGYGICGRETLPHISIPPEVRSLTPWEVRKKIRILK